MRKIQTLVSNISYLKLKALAAFHGKTMGEIIDLLLRKVEVPKNEGHR